MTAIADLLLDGIKQYAQSLKKQLNVSLAKSQELTATFHRFADWHELTVVASRDPLDERLRGAALSRRSSPAVNTPSAIEQVMQAEERMPGLTSLSDEQSIAADRKARGFANGEMPPPSFHLNFRATRLRENEAFHGMNEQFRLNLFDPKPRFVGVYGVTGWGKSALGVSIGLAHAAQGGNVCHLDPFIGELTSPADWPGKMRDIMLDGDGGSRQTVGKDGSLQSFSRITGLGCSPFDRPRPPLDVVLRSIKERLLPFSIVIIDEPAAFSHSTDQSRRVAHEIDQILAAGTAVVWLSQDMPTEETLPLNRQSQENAVLILGKTNSWTRLSIRQAVLAQVCQRLPMERDKSNCWVAAVSTSGRPPEAYILEVRCDEIEAQAPSPALSRPARWELPQKGLLDRNSFQLESPTESRTG